MLFTPDSCLITSAYEDTPTNDFVCNNHHFAQKHYEMFIELKNRDGDEMKGDTNL